MRIDISVRQSQLVAIFLLIVALGLAFAALAVPVWWLHQHYDYYIDDYSDRLRRYQQIADLRSQIEHSISTVTERDAGKYYLKGATPALAGAELQGLVTRIVEAQKGKLFSSQILANNSLKEDEPISKIAIQVQLSAAIIPLQLILHSLEANQPYLFIDKLLITSNFGRLYKPLPGVQPDYQVQLTVSAYVRPREAIP